MRRIVFIAVLLAFAVLNAELDINVVLEQIRTEKAALEKDFALCDSLITNLMNTDSGFAERDMFETPKEYLSRITANAHKIIDLRKKYTLNHLSVLDSLRALDDFQPIDIKMEFIGYDRDYGRAQLGFRSLTPPFSHYYEGSMESDFARYIYNNPDSLMFNTAPYIGDDDEVALHLIIIDSPVGWYKVFFDRFTEEMSGIKACFSDDGRYVAYYDSKNEPSVVKIRRENWHSEVCVGAPVKCISLSPDGKYLALGIHATPEYETDFWVLKTEDNSIVMSGSVEGGVTSVDISPDGRLLAVGGGFTFVASTAHLYEIQTGDMLLDFSDYHVISAVKFSPDQRYVASTGRSLAVWDLSTMEKHIYEWAPSYITCMDFHPDGTSLVVGNNRGGGYQFYNLETKEVNSYQWKGDISSLCYDFKGRYLMIGGSEGRILDLGKSTYGVPHKDALYYVYRPGFRRVFKLPEW